MSLRLFKQIMALLQLIKELIVSRKYVYLAAYQKKQILERIKKHQLTPTLGKIRIFYL